MFETLKYLVEGENEEVEKVDKKAISEKIFNLLLTKTDSRQTEQRRFEELIELVGKIDDVNTPDSTMLYYSCKYEDSLEFIKKLVEKKNAKIDQRCESTPLLYACYKGQYEVAKYLLSKGANPNAKDDAGFTPIFYSTMENHFNIVRELCGHGADVNFANEKGSTPLHFACMYRLPEVTLVLLNNGGQNVANEAGRKPSELCGDEKEIVKFFELKKEGLYDEMVRRKMVKKEGESEEKVVEVSEKVVEVSEKVVEKVEKVEKVVEEKKEKFTITEDDLKEIEKRFVVEISKRMEEEYREKSSEKEKAYLKQLKTIEEVYEKKLKKIVDENASNINKMKETYEAQIKERDNTIQKKVVKLRKLKKKKESYKYFSLQLKGDQEGVKKELKALIDEHSKVVAEKEILDKIRKDDTKGFMKDMEKTRSELKDLKKKYADLVEVCKKMEESLKLRDETIKELKDIRFSRRKSVRMDAFSTKNIEGIGSLQLRKTLHKFW